MIMNEGVVLGIVCSHPAEMRAVLAIMKEKHDVRFSLFKGCEGRLGERPCVAIESGMGGDRAYVATKQLLPIYRPRVILDFGLAAGLRADIVPGDVVVADRVLDCSVFLGSWKERDPFLTNDPPGTVLEEGSVLEPAEGVLAAAERNGLKRAAVGSAEFFLESGRVRDALRDLGVDVFDYETWSVGLAAHEAGVSWASLRAVSDGGTQSAREDFHRHMKASLSKASEALARFAAAWEK